MTTKKKRNPTDSTMRNVRAANKRIKALEVTVEALLRALPLYIFSTARDTTYDPDVFAKALELSKETILAQKQPKK